MDVLRLFLVPVALIIVYHIISFYLYKHKTHFILRGFYPSKLLPSTNLLPTKDLIESLKLLYLNGKVHKLFVNDEYVSFEDRGYFQKRNVYYIVFAETNKIYYRGTVRVFNVNKINLETIYFILTDVSEKGSGSIHL